MEEVEVPVSVMEYLKLSKDEEKWTTRETENGLSENGEDITQYAMDRSSKRYKIEFDSAFVDIKDSDPLQKISRLSVGCDEWVV